jgi:NDP-sugar pyrophosphorylase family protein
MKALILAAGQGTRLKQLTAHRPKPLLPLRGQPVLVHTIRWLQSYGIGDIAVNVHHHADAVVAALGDGTRLGVSITYSHEERLLGTAGAAKRLAGYLTEPFVVVYGDVLTNLDLSRLIHFHHSRPGSGRSYPALTLALYHVPEPSQCGLVETGAAGRIRRFVEKPPADQVFTDLAFSGVMVCEPRILRFIPEGDVYDFGHHLIPLLLAAGEPLYAQPIDRAAGEYVIDIGTLQGYLAALHTCAPLPPAVASSLGTRASA